ncbi:hypothetical protein EI74_0030 [Mycoplasma testudineum]|uniref:Uncharacterized protein n=1 Tax=Mycoplasma testudineum TaxID=244584 RepID=A0A4R6IJD3_9MOLU|nr:hypothetical protein [Mycoplasma testudineum]OYD26435.1 hypothetical protein CG473_03960 [Mycoplasma testudineum]TDO22124.1 hypothetical protein EI74_0030 [Mycoplasma testudineum]
MLYNKNSSYKIAIAKWQFLTLMLLIVIILFIYSLGSILSLVDSNAISEYSISQGLSGMAALNQFRLVIILRLVVTSIVYIGFGLITYYSYKKINFGFIYVLFWSFIQVASIVSVWAINISMLWVSILVSITSVAILCLLFYMFIMLNQKKFFVNNQRRWV